MHRTPTSPGPGSRLTLEPKPGPGPVGPAGPSVIASHIPTAAKRMVVATYPKECSRCRIHALRSGLVLGGGEIFDAAGGELVPQAVEVQAQLAVGQGLAGLDFLGHPGLRGR